MWCIWKIRHDTVLIFVLVIQDSRLVFRLDSLVCWSRERVQIVSSKALIIWKYKHVVS